MSKKPDGEAHVEASGPIFSNVKVDWDAGTSGAPSADVQNTTAITWYKLDKAPWYSIYTWQLTINCTDTYNYQFTDATNDSYSLDVYSTSTSHEVESILETLQSSTCLDPRWNPSLWV